jgi:hypothetical protein
LLFSLLADLLSAAALLIARFSVSCCNALTEVPAKLLPLPEHDSPAQELHRTEEWGIFGRRSTWPVDRAPFYPFDLRSAELVWRRLLAAMALWKADRWMDRRTDAQFGSSQALDAPEGPAECGSANRRNCVSGGAAAVVAGADAVREGAAAVAAVDGAATGLGDCLSTGTSASHRSGTAVGSSASVLSVSHHNGTVVGGSAGVLSVSMPVCHRNGKAVGGQGRDLSIARANGGGGSSSARSGSCDAGGDCTWTDSNGSKPVDVDRRGRRRPAAGNAERDGGGTAPLAPGFVDGQANGRTDRLMDGGLRVSGAEWLADGQAGGHVGGSGPSSGVDGQTDLLTYTWSNKVSCSRGAEAVPSGGTSRCEAVYPSGDGMEAAYPSGGGGEACSGLRIIGVGPANDRIVEADRPARMAVAAARKAAATARPERQTDRRHIQTLAS